MNKPSVAFMATTYGTKYQPSRDARSLESESQALGLWSAMATLLLFGFIGLGLSWFEIMLTFTFLMVACRFVSHQIQRQQWKNFILLLEDPSRNCGISGTSIRMLLSICNERRDAGTQFSFQAIEGHARFRQAVSLHVLVNLFDEAGCSVSMSFPFEQPGGGYTYEGDNAIAAPASLRHDTIYTRDKIPVKDETLEFGCNWELFYECCSDCGVSEELVYELTELESDYSMRYGLVDCNKEYVQFFCEQAKWQQELIDAVLDYYHASLEDEPDETESLDPIADDDDALDTAADYLPEPDNVTTHDNPDDVSFESLVAESESLNAAGGTLKFSAAARVLQHNSLRRRVACREPSLVKPKAVAAIDDTRPLGFEWHVDDKDRRVRRSLRVAQKKERTEARCS